MSKTPQEVALAVAEAIQQHPEQFYMDAWVLPLDDYDEEPNLCNTSFCIAGWACVVAGYKVGKVDEWGEVPFLDPETGGIIDPELMGKKLLGLDGTALFYNMYLDAEDAVDLLTILAHEGEDAMYDKMDEIS